MHVRNLFFVAAFSYFSLSSAIAQIAPEPSRTTAMYGDWIVRCENISRNDKTVRNCEIAQSFANGNGQGNLAQIVIGRPQGENLDRVFVELPAGVWLPDGVMLKVADTDLIELSFKRCPQSCFASAVLATGQRETLFSASKASFVFKDATQNPVTISLSLKGMREAYGAIANK